MSPDLRLCAAQSPVRSACRLPGVRSIEKQHPDIHWTSTGHPLDIHRTSMGQPTHPQWLKQSPVTPASPPFAMGATPSVQEDLQKLKTSPAKSRPRREAFQRLQKSLGCWIVAIHSRLLHIVTAFLGLFFILIYCNVLYNNGFTTSTKSETVGRSTNQVVNL